MSKQTSSAIGWLDYVEINARRNLTFTSSQFTFRDKRVIGGSGTYAKYMLTNNASSFPLIWDVTNPLNVKINYTPLPLLLILNILVSLILLMNTSYLMKL